ncbi:MAG: hypothetical protein QOF73_4670, partial [Thermomicrobiales bacterium]|nr:hypothetical protein [Thermomicrobiales bacterium]
MGDAVGVGNALEGRTSVRPAEG